MPPRPLILPFKAKNLSKHDLEQYRPMFASYLDIQKQRDIEDMDDKEVKGRWKSFVGRWNRKELAEGWYDPETKRKANASWAEETVPAPAAVPPSLVQRQEAADDLRGDSDSGGDEVGPPPPPKMRGRPGAGASNATFSDLTMRDEQHAEDAANARGSIRAARKEDRALQKSRLDELVPRAEPGTKERQLEKKRENAAAARGFRDAKGGPGEMEEVGEGQLMGGVEGREEVREMRQKEEKKKTERELRREEVWRARQAEREERLEGLRAKEDATMAGLKAIARERFGGGGKG